MENQINMRCQFKKLKFMNFKIGDVMDSYQKLNIKWFIFSISVAEK